MSKIAYLEKFYIVSLFLLTLNQFVSGFEGLLYIEPVIILIFCVLIISRNVKFDYVDASFIILILLFFVGGVVYDLTNTGGYHLQFKNLIIYWLVFFISKHLIKEHSTFILILFLILWIVFLITIQFINEGIAVGASSFSGDRSLFLFIGLTWNGLVGTISLIYPIILYLFTLKEDKSRLFLFTLCFFALFFAFIVILSGGRQAAATIGICVSFYFYRKFSISKFLVLFSTGFMLYIIFTNLLSLYYPDFFEFSETKKESFLDDLINVRIMWALVEPMLKFDLVAMIFNGNPTYSTHNILSTVIYKYGFFGTIFFWFRFYLIRKSLKNRIPTNSDILIFFDTIFISFFATNFVANIWFQVTIYGFLLWVLCGCFIGVSREGRHEF